MESTNLGAGDGLAAIDWTLVEEQLTDLSVHDDPRSPNRATFWLTTLNADGSPHATSVGALWHAGSGWFQTGDRTRKARNVTITSVGSIHSNRRTMYRATPTSPRRSYETRQP